MEENIMTDGLIEALLDDRQHHIEFNGHLTNHVKHAVIALHGLGIAASDIRAYYDNYARCTSYGYGLEPARPATLDITEANWSQFLGQRRHFAAYCRFFDAQERELGMPRLLQRYLPTLLPGWAGAFTHATIHLGWALDIEHRWMTIEGLAYMCFTFVSCHPERLPASSPAAPGVLDEMQPIDSLLRFADDWEQDRAGLRDWAQAIVADTDMQQVEGFHPELRRSGLQYRIARLLHEGHPMLYRMPAWIASPADAGSGAGDFEALYFAAALLYLAKPGDFVLLHLITSLHAMEQIARCLPSDQRQPIIRCFWIGLLAIGMAGGSFPKRAKLVALRAMFERAVDDDTRLAAADWQQIATRAALEEEEHNPKLAYVLRRVWHRSGCRTVYRVAASQFTMTPALPASFEQPTHD